MCRIWLNIHNKYIIRIMQALFNTLQFIEKTCQYDKMFYNISHLVLYIFFLHEYDEFSNTMAEVRYGIFIQPNDQLVIYNFIYNFIYDHLHTSITVRDT